MKPEAIHVDRIYTDNTSHRLVLDEGPQYKTMTYVDPQPFLKVARLDGPKIQGERGKTPEGHQIMFISKASMAKWAKREVAAADVPKAKAAAPAP